MTYFEIAIFIFIAAAIFFGSVKVIRYLISSSKEFDILKEQINTFFDEIDNNKKIYFTYSTKERLLSEYSSLRKLLDKKIYQRKSKTSEVQDYISMYDTLDAKVKQWNKEYIENELTKNIAFFSDIDGKSLDEEQRLAVVTDEDNNLVLAGAGSGKTLTISAKVKYLVDRKGIKSNEILLLSFTRKAAEEMQERISQRLNINVEAKTFHRLGLEIISKAKGYRPDINSDTDIIVEEYFRNEIIGNKGLVSDIMQFFSYYLEIPKDLEEAENLGEVYDHYRTINLETLKSKMESLKKEKKTLQSERVKSFEEVLIANFLFLNGINYEYERRYPYKSDDRFRKQYRPDFYLPDYDMYIEHFGVTADNKAPWLSEIEEKKYLDGIRWKRAVHKENKTVLLETYSYYNSEGRLLIELEKMLKNKGVKFTPADYDHIYKSLFINNNDRYFNEFKKLTHTFVGLFKSAGLPEDWFDKAILESDKIENTFFRNRTKLFVSLVKPLYKYYQDELKKHEQIDFNDMINMATEFVKNKVVDLKLKYIVVDEYQDMSISRYNLIKSLRDNTRAKTVCVGDDWQSIYRFTGSDIDLFVNFSKYFGYTELLKIQKTYRNSQELIDIAGRFIMENPRQFKKELRADKSLGNPIRIFGYENEFFEAFARAADDVVKHSQRDDAEIMLIGRTNYDIDVFDVQKVDNVFDKKLAKDFKVIRNAEQVRLVYKRHPKLKIYFLTAHRSKGLEADYVIVLNLKNHLLGFPNKISDDPVLGLVLTDLDSFSYAEERRLFYVSITRTKNNTYLLAPQPIMSIFADELINKQKIRYEFMTDEQNLIDNPNCPRCGKGYLILRENAETGDKFLGCSNFPLCGNTFKNIEILDNQIKCSCGSYMVKRIGSYGEFYGCTNYPHCHNKYRIEKETTSVC